jgi:hypothetical protein
LSDGSLWQEAALKTLGVPRVVFPQRGTVTASALDLALRCTSGIIFLAGMDLSNEDIKTHARPYAFDRFQEEGATRLTPRYSRAFVRAGQIAASGSHRVYAEWFGGQLAAYPGRIRSLGKNNPVFNVLPAGKKPAGADTAHGTKRVCIETGVLRKVPPDAAGEAVRVLARLLNRPGPAEALLRELGPLLLPGSGEISPQQLLKEIETLTSRKGTGEGTADE